jgi:hypothetical protein
MHVYAQCADTSTKTFMLQIAVSRRPIAKIKKLKVNYFFDNATWLGSG